MAYNNLYQIEVSHSGLNKYRIVKGSTRWEAEQKANALRAQWNEQWKRKQEQMKKQEIRQQKIQVNEYGLKYAEEMTDEANDIQAKLDRILVDSLNSVQFDFDSLKDHTKFTAAKPKPPIYGQYPREPLRTDLIYNPKPPLLAKLSKSKLDAFNQENNNVFIKDHMKWEEEVRQIDISNNNLRGNYESAVNKWESDKKAFYDNQDENNRSIDEFEETVKNGDNQAIEGLFSLILNDIKYPFDYDKDVDVQYFPDEHQLIVEMFLPVQEDIPNKKAVTYVKSKQEIKESFYPEAYMKKKYDSVVYQIVMQTLNYCFNLSICDLSIESVVLNGRVRTIDKSTGNAIEPCILSVSSKKEDFCKLNLETIDPKAWFKSSKGVSAATLVNLTPVAPIVEMNKEDKRFIDVYAILHNCGFKHIKQVELKDIYVGSNYIENEIDKVELNGQAHFAADNLFPYDATVIITIHKKIEISIPYNSSSLRRLNYNEVCSRLSSLGFTEIKLVPIKDLVIGLLTKNGAVEKVLVNESKSFKKNTFFKYDTDIIVYYHTFKKG